MNRGPRNPDSSGSGPNPLGEELAARLLARAREARAFSYSPYSNYPVGAALLATDGRIFTGANVENSSYGLTTCAERTAVVKAVSEGAREFVGIAIAGPEDDVACPPCGSCLQILQEVAPGLLVVSSDEGGHPRTLPLAELLPMPFGAARLRKGQASPGPREP